MIEWLPSGEAVVVLKSFDLASKILPRYFKSGQYESFVRKLNRWGFRRDSRGRRTGAFYHENFIRDRPDLMVHMSNRRAVANPRGLGPKHLRGIAGMNPPPGAAATAAAVAAAADRQHANATIGLGLGVGLDVMSGLSDADFIALRHRQMARQHAAAAAQAQAAGGGMAGASYPPMGAAAEPMQSAPGFMEAYAAHEASRMGLRHGSAAAGAPGAIASPPGSSAVAGAPGLPPPLPPHAAGMGPHLGASPRALHGDALLHQRHFLGTGADPLIQEASLVGRANGNPQLAAAAADLAEAEAELVRLRSLRALRAGGVLPPQHAHMAHPAPGAVPGSMPHLAGPGASPTGTGMPPLPAAGAPMPTLPPQAGEAPPGDEALAPALAAAPGAPAPGASPSAAVAPPAPAAPATAAPTGNVTGSV